MLSLRLKQLREERNLKQKDIAKLLNISVSAYGFYEQGKRDPSKETIAFLANFYNVSTDYLIGGENDLSMKIDKSDELAIWVGKLLRPVNDGSFQQRFIHMLSRLDEKDWNTIEKMVSFMNEEKAGQDA